MSFSPPADPAHPAVRMPAGQAVLLDPSLHPSGTCVQVLEGMARVYCPCEDTEGGSALLRRGLH
jgi:hypothetical protein